MLAGLLSAFMSTFSATVNAGAAYLVYLGLHDSWVVSALPSPA